MIGVEGAARAGYVTKSGIYGLIGILAFRQAMTTGGSTSGGREAIRTIAAGPLGRILLTAVCVGLAGYVVWRLFQAVADPGGDGGDGGWKRWGVRAFYLGSAVLYGFLALFAFRRTGPPSIDAYPAFAAGSAYPSGHPLEAAPVWGTVLYVVSRYACRVRGEGDSLHE